VSGTTTQMYVFDAVLRAEHSGESHVTEHPVQTGANISDHAYAMPARVTLEIGMSDVMDSYSHLGDANAQAAAGTWTGTSNSKSVNAFQTLDSWRLNRVLLTLNTRLKSYASMVVESATPTESKETFTGLRCRVVFKQVLIANTQTIADSVRPQDTESTNTGTVTGTPPTASQTAQYAATQGSTVVGAGTWSSNSSSAGS